ncbi:MAG: ribbon-helix-helix protein, CopG family [Acidobacteriota bacterium]
MVRTQIYIDEAQKTTLDRLSSERHMTVSDLVRRAIDEFIGGNEVRLQEGLRRSFGIWKNRHGLGETGRYVRGLRRQWRTRKSRM